MANQKVLCLFLCGLRRPDTGKPLFTNQQLATAFGYSARQHVQNFEQEFRACESDLLRSLQRKRKVDASVLEALREALRRQPLAPATELCPQVQERLKRPELTLSKIREAMKHVPCTAIRPLLQQHWERGEFHPKEVVLLQRAFTALQETSSSPSSSVVATLTNLGLGRSPRRRLRRSSSSRRSGPVLFDARASLGFLVSGMTVIRCYIRNYE